MNDGLRYIQFHLLCGGLHCDECESQSVVFCSRLFRVGMIRREILDACVLFLLKMYINDTRKVLNPEAMFGVRSVVDSEGI